MEKPLEVGEIGKIVYSRFPQNIGMLVEIIGTDVGGTMIDGYRLPIKAYYLGNIFGDPGKPWTFWKTSVVRITDPEKTVDA